ncbi:MAG: InlB B-repeat-containing protein [Clostridiales Family XIII bacterium]|nr:InlB B-repeat-containing protein [Clostridiales Family XIII bacterium]
MKTNVFKIWGTVRNARIRAGAFLLLCVLMAQTALPASALSAGYGNRGTTPYYVSRTTLYAYLEAGDKIFIYGNFADALADNPPATSERSYITDPAGGVIYDTGMVLYQGNETYTHSYTSPAAPVAGIYTIRMEQDNSGYMLGTGKALDVLDYSGSPIPGRIWTDMLCLDQPWGGPFTSTLYGVANSGYRYAATFWGLDGIRSVIQLSQNGSSQKMFFEPPSPALPKSIVPDPIGEDAFLGKVTGFDDSRPCGGRRAGNIRYCLDPGYASPFELQVDCDADGMFGGAKDRAFSLAATGSNGSETAPLSLPFDGRDGAGGDIPLARTLNFRLFFSSVSEIRIDINDAEALGGLSFVQLNGGNAGNDLIEYDPYRSEGIGLDAAGNPASIPQASYALPWKTAAPIHSNVSGGVGGWYLDSQTDASKGNVGIVTFWQTTDLSAAVKNSAAANSVYTAEGLKANWEARHILVDENGNESLDSKTTGNGYAGAAVSFLAGSFEGYTENTSYAGTLTSSSIDANGGTVLKRFYLKNIYQVRFDDGFESMLKKDDVPHGAAATAPEGPEIEGLIFRGWDKAFDLITEDTSVSALWDVHIAFDDGFGALLKDDVIGYGAAATAPQDPELEGLVFCGWDKAFNDVRTETAVSAQWGCRVRFYDGAAERGGVLLKEEIVPYGSAAAPPEDPWASGWWYLGWDKPFDNIKTDTVITALWQQHPVAPKTGDETALGLLFAALIDSGALAVLLLLALKRRRNSQMR